MKINFASLLFFVFQLVIFGSGLNVKRSTLNVKRKHFWHGERSNEKVVFCERKPVSMSMSNQGR